MFTFLEKYFVKAFCKFFLIIIILFFPFILVSEYVITGRFILKQALYNVVYRYGQSFTIILFLSSYLTTSIILSEYNKIFFIQLGCDWKIFLKSIFLINIKAYLLYYLIIIPSNNYFFPRKIHSSNWSIHKENKDTIVYNNKERWQYKEGNWTNYEKEQMTNEDQKYIIWNYPKYLSIEGLNECRKYYISQGWDDSDILKQKYVILLRFFIFLLSILIGYCCALYRFIIGVFGFVFLSSWIDFFLFFFNIYYCIVFICTYLAIGFILNIYYLYYWSYH